MAAGTESLAGLISPERIVIGLRARTKEDVLAELCALLPRGDCVCDAAAALDAVARREAVGCTGIGSGVAVPHARAAATPRTVAAVGISREGVPFGAPDGLPVHIFFLLVGPPESAGLHLRLLSQVARLAKDEAVRMRLLEARTPAEVVAYLK